MNTYINMLLLRFLEILFSCLFVLSTFTQIVWPMLNNQPLFPLFRKSPEKEKTKEDKPQRSTLKPKPQPTVKN